MFITKKKHEAIVATMAADIRQAHDALDLMASDNRALDTAAAHFKQQRDAARAEAEANKAELARWRQYGQMRDPATGRLIPRVKAEVA